MQAELYEMEAAMAVGVNPEWIVPYTTVKTDYQALLDGYSAFVQVGFCHSLAALTVSLHLRAQAMACTRQSAQ